MNLLRVTCRSNSKAIASHKAPPPQHGWQLKKPESLEAYPRSASRSCILSHAQACIHNNLGQLQPRRDRWVGSQGRVWCPSPTLLSLRDCHWLHGHSLFCLFHCRDCRLKGVCRFYPLMQGWAPYRVMHWNVGVWKIWLPCTVLWDFSAAMGSEVTRAIFSVHTLYIQTFLLLEASQFNYGKRRLLIFPHYSACRNKMSVSFYSCI